MDDQTETPDEHNDGSSEHNRAAEATPTETRARNAIPYGWPINPALPITFRT